VSRPRAALAGAAAALVWAALEPLDKRLFRNDYSDIALLGKFATRTRAWPIAGFALHALNGAVFGIAFEEARRHTTVPPRRLALVLALGEHVALFPLSYVVDRKHPARGEPGVRNVSSGRGFAQATARHALFGAILGRLVREERP
jgi:hypothetical protein